VLQAQVLLAQQVRKDRPVHQVVLLVQQVLREVLELQAQLVHVDQQVQMVQQAQQVPRLLFLAQQDRLDRKVLQLTLEDQLQLQQIFLHLATQLTTLIL
jgi:hypothetical protein